MHIMCYLPVIGLAYQLWVTVHLVLSGTHSISDNYINSLTNVISMAYVRHDGAAITPYVVVTKSTCIFVINRIMRDNGLEISALNI